MPEHLNSPALANQGCKPLLGEISVQNILQDPVYFSEFAGYITLGIGMAPSPLLWPSVATPEKETEAIKTINAHLSGLEASVLARGRLR